ncbi:MAG: PilN domain-containing protein [Gemmatimonadota bacterium]|nr:PilN domain-containing protein [Gemmatimonadota bacterium]
MIKINLLPPEKRKKAKKAKPAKKKAAAASRAKLDFKFDPLVVAPLAAAVIVVLLIAGSFFYLGHQEKKLKARRDANRVELNLMNLTVARIDKLKEKTREVSRRMEIILDVDRNRFLWPRLLDEISGAMPPYTWLQAISETSPFPELVLRLEGTTMTNLSVSRFLANLGRASMIGQARLINSEESIHGSYDAQRFIIECTCALNEPPDSAGAEKNSGK